MPATTLEVANTILQQLGARRFIAMTGAKNFVGSADSLTFRIPRANGISQVRVTLTAGDDYTMQFIGKRGDQLAVLKEITGVYCDQLQSIFTAETGLYTRL